MGSTVSRKIDELSRIVLPKEFSIALNLTEKDSIDITLQEDRNCIVLRKSKVSCSICGISDVQLLQLGKDRKNKHICENCKSFIEKADMNTAYY